MCSQKIRWIFYSFSLFFLSSCGSGLLLDTKQDIIQASSPACPLAEPASSIASSTANFTANSTASKLLVKELKKKVHFISQKIHITKKTLNLASDILLLDLQINTQCSFFKKANNISKAIILQSPTKTIKSLDQQYYSYKIKKQNFFNFAKQVQADYCIKRVYLGNSFFNLKTVKTKNLAIRQPRFKAKNKLTTKTLSAEDFNDPFLYRQSHLWAINAFKAFKKIYHSQYGLKKETPKSIIAIIDGGVSPNHEDLQGVFLIQENLTTGGRGNVNHGTHVASLIAAKANNDIGVLGLASKSVKLITYAVPTAQNTFQARSSIANALLHIDQLQLRKPQVVNISLTLGSKDCSDSGTLMLGGNKTIISTAIKKLLDKGISVVVSAGNNKDGVGKKFKLAGDFYIKYPTCLSRRTGFENLIAVGAVDVNSDARINRKSVFSDFGSDYVQIAAPGNSALGIGLYSAIDKNKYGWQAGTSQAAPLVSSAMALAYSVLNKKRHITIDKPDEQKSIFEKCGITNNKKMQVVKDLMLNSANKVSSMSKFWKNGNVLNLESLIDKIEFLYPDATKK